MADPNVCRLCVDGVFQLMTTLFTLTIVPGALGAEGTTAATAEITFDVTLKPIALRA
jgi:hypothetical protein